MGTLPLAPSDLRADRGQDCNVAAIDWAILVLTTITVHVTWWALNIPTLFREGYRAYLEDVAWECLRMHQPGYVGLVGCMLTKRKDWWQAKYYTGRTKELSAFKKYVKPFVIDSLIIVSTIMSIYRLCVGLHHGQDLSGLNSSLWAYPSLPVALTGIWITIASKIQLRLRWVVLGQFVIIAAVATSIALAIHYNDPGQTNIWIGSTVVFAVMGLPIALLDPRLAVIVVILASVARAAGPIFGALSPQAYFPFCSLRGAKFAAPLIVFMILAGIFALGGMIITLRALQRDFEERKARKARQERGNELREST